MPRITRIVMYPEKARNGPTNGNYKHGRWSNYITKEEREQLDEDQRQYLQTYPYLKEPVALDMLREALMIKDVRIPRMEKRVFQEDVPLRDMLAAQSELDKLVRTLALLFSRLGITYQSKQRHAPPKRVKSPLEMITEDDK